MKKFLNLIWFSILFCMIFCTFACANTESDFDDVTKESETSLTDSEGKTIYSGSASVSFTYNNQTTTKTISAAYLINGVTVNITSGTYEAASDSSDKVVFLVINGGTLNITGEDGANVSITKSGSAAQGGQVSDDYNFYGINSGIVVSGSYSKANIKELLKK